jgi:hypothetical protein
MNSFKASFDTANVGHSEDKESRNGNSSAKFSLDFEQLEAWKAKPIRCSIPPFPDSKVCVW